MIAAIKAFQPWPWSRQRAAALGLVAAALGLSHRMAFAVSRPGIIGIFAGVAILAAVAMVRQWPGPKATLEELNLVFAGAFVLLVFVGALRPYRDDILASGLVILAAVLFFVLEPFPGLRRRRLWLVTPVLLAAHAVLVLHLPFPKQDVFRFLTLGVDGLFRHGLDPYRPIPDPVSADVRPYTFTYPPGAALLVAPFRLFLGDVRWAFVAAEAAFVAAVAVAARRRGEIATWQHAAILLPLVFPRTNQAYFDFGNHEWVLLALAAAAIALRHRWLWSGLLLGLGIATKQYFVVFPVLFLLPWLERRALVAAAAVALAVVLPFLIWDAGSLLHDTTNQLGAPPDPDRLTIYAMLRGAGLDVGRAGAGFLAVVGLALALASAWWGRRSLDRALVACGVGLCLFTLFADFSAYNYFGYALAFVAWGVAISDPDEGKEPGRAGGVSGVTLERGPQHPLLHDRPQ